MTALTYMFLAIIFLSIGYLFGWHVRGEVEQQPRLDERKKKSYEVKAERYFNSN